MYETATTTTTAIPYNNYIAILVCCGLTNFSYIYVIIHAKESNILYLTTSCG